MRRLIPFFIAFLLLFCSLASWQVAKCMVLPCGNETSVECSSEKECSKSSPQQENGCGKSTDSPAPCCCVCVGIGCYYLLPEHGFRLRPLADDGRQKPLGQQHLFPQSFHPSIWHPPAPAGA